MVVTCRGVWRLDSQRSHPFRAPRSVKRIRYALQGSAALLFISFNTIVLALVMGVMAIFKGITPPGTIANAINRWLSVLGELWVSGNNFVLRHYRSMQWDIQRPENLDRQGRYLVLCNHQSWVDILAMQFVLNRRAPFLRFMLKQSLIWVPFLGLAWWSLDFPFLRRHSRQQLLKNPQLRFKDLENAARACEKLKLIPVAMMCFPEGTRFSREKHSRQVSPYRHLLKPRFGGIGQVLYSFEDALQSAIDMTITYPGGAPTFWQLVSGQVPKIKVQAVLRPIDPGLLGVDFRGNPEAKRQLKDWLESIWMEKDQAIVE